MAVDLPEREARVLRMRSGLDGGFPMTFEEISGQLGVSLERSRQIANTAMDRVERMAYRNNLDVPL